MRRSRQHRHSTSLGERPRPQLVAEKLEHLRARPDEADTLLSALPGKSRVLAQEAVARMNRVASGLPGDGQNLLAVEVRGGAGAAQRVRFVRFADVERPGVVLGENRHSPDAEFGGGAKNANRDLASIRDQ